MATLPVSSSRFESRPIGAASAKAADLRKKVVPLTFIPSQTGGNIKVEAEKQRDKAMADWMTFATAVATIISICGLAHGVIGIMAGRSLTASVVASSLASAGGSFLGSRLLIFKRDQWKEGNIEASDKISLLALGLLGLGGFVLPAIASHIPKIGSLAAIYGGPLVASLTTTGFLYLWKRDAEIKEKINKQKEEAKKLADKKDEKADEAKEIGKKAEEAEKAADEAKETGKAEEAEKAKEGMEG